jgi:hypothetical protein
MLRLCDDVMNTLTVRTSRAIRVERMSFDSRTSIFQKKVKVTHEMKRYVMTANLLELKGVSLD